MYRGFLAFLVKTKNKAYTKLTVVMGCQICDRRSVAPSSGDFRRRLQVPARAGSSRRRSSSMVTGKKPLKSCLAWSDHCRQKQGPVMC